MEAPTPQERIDRLAAALKADPDHNKNISWADRLMTFRTMVENRAVWNASFLLPCILNLNGEPYSLRDHFPFESVFNVHMPRRIVMKTGRQVSKSTSLAARGILLANSIRNFKLLYVTPLFEQIRRFSNNYVKPFIDQSPVKALWSDTTTENSVLQRTFKNNSRMIFSFAYLNADRTRGISSDMIAFDEVQDLDRNHIPIIVETMSHSKWKLIMYTGTPKTFDNTIEGLWSKSSMGEWAIPCPHCGKLNIPAKEYDLYRMIGPLPKKSERALSEEVPGTICANPSCERRLSPRQGRWMHRVQKLMHEYPGYHVPQPIMPIHYADSDAWRDLLGKREGRNNTSPAAFDNETLGESSEQGIKLVTLTDLREASILPWKNDPLGKTAPTEALLRLNDYTLRILAVDWGGGGDEEVSFTKLAIVCLLPSGKIDVIYGRMLLTPSQHFTEAVEVMKAYNTFKCHGFAHDFNGAGTVRESLMIQAGVPYEQVFPFVYHPLAHKNIVVFHKSTADAGRDYWLLDKARSLLLTASCIKLKQIRFFQFDFEDNDNPGLLHDFIALVENKVEMARGREIYTIQRNPQFQDDFAHAVNFGCAAIWHQRGWPDLANIANIRISEQEMRMIAPDHPWEHMDEDMGGFLGMP